MKKNRLARFFLTNASGIFLSRIFGFLRDALQAAILGTSIYSDIFFIAFKFPNMFRRVVSEGAFVQSFLPFLLSARNKGAFSLSIFVIFILGLLTLTGLVLCFAPFITKLLALGYDESRISLALPLVKIHFWYLLLIFIVTYFSALLQYRQHFWVGAYNTVLLNLAMIFALLFAKAENLDLLEATYVLSYSVLVGGVCQIILHFYPLYSQGLWRLQALGLLRIKKWRRQSGLRLGLKGLYFEKPDSVTPAIFAKAKARILGLLADLRLFFKAFIPAMLGASSAQLIALIDSSLVTLLPDSTGGVSVLNFANRIFQLPLALFAIAISSALFPLIARSLKDGNLDLALRNLKTAFWFLLITLSLCVLGGYIMRNEIVWLLFERGNFNRADTLAVAAAFVGYMLGLLPFGLVKIFSLWLYATKKQAKAAKFSVIALLVGTILAGGFILTLRYGEITNGLLWDLRYFFIAMAGSIGGFVLLGLTLREFGLARFLAILFDKRRALLLLTLLCITFVLLEALRRLFAIS